MSIRRILWGSGAVALFATSAHQSAQAIDLQISGFVRQEVAVKITGQRNIYSQGGNLFNGVTESMPDGLGGPGVTNTRPASLSKNNTFNQFDTRFELNLDSHLTDSLTAHIKVRGVYDEIGRVEDAFRGADLYGGNFGYGHNSGGNLLEVTSKAAMVDLPSAYVDYNNGALWLRAGNQQIAWGEALFFRVADQVDGLDLRRHSVLGIAAEEYSDTRVPSPGLRGSYHFEGDNDVTIEAYTQKFQPTVLPGLYSPYDVVASQFYIDDREGYDKVAGEMNFGARISGSVADYGLTLFAIMEHDANGVFKWSAASGGGPLHASTGFFPSQSAFTVNNTGVYSAQEWYAYAAASRLDGIGGLASGLNDFGVGSPTGGPGGTPGAGYLVASACAAKTGAPLPTGAGSINVKPGADANCILDTLFTGESLTGYLSREYPYQRVWGGSVNHIFEGEPNSFLDQLIARAEVSYTPHKKFTSPTLGNYIARDEAQLAIILEKYQKFGTSIPATYMVGQYLHKTQSDIFGRSLVGCDNIPGSAPRGCGGGSNYFAFALQQPSPTLRYRFDFTMLTDIKGGWLFQPGIKFKPSEHLQFDLYSNLIYSTASNEYYTNFAQGAEYGREIFARATYYF